jgi:hypothetical protein
MAIYRPDNAFGAAALPRVAGLCLWGPRNTLATNSLQDPTKSCLGPRKTCLGARIWRIVRASMAATCLECSGQRPSIKYLRFPFKLPKRGPVIFERIVVWKCGAQAGSHDESKAYVNSEKLRTAARAAVC